MNDRWAHKSTTCKSYIGWAARVGARGWPFKDNMAVGFNCFSILFYFYDVIKHKKKKEQKKTGREKNVHQAGRIYIFFAFEVHHT